MLLKIQLIILICQLNNKQINQLEGLDKMAKLKLQGLFREGGIVKAACIEGDPVTKEHLVTMGGEEYKVKSLAHMGTNSWRVVFVDQDGFDISGTFYID